MNSYRLLDVTAYEIRYRARKSLNGRWKNASLAVIMMMLIVALPDIIYYLLNYRMYLGTLETPASTYSAIYTFIALSLAELGMAAYFLNMIRGRSQKFVDVLEGFEYIVKAMGLLFMVTLFTVLWTMLFVIPGIVASLRYSQAFYILAENPELSVMECINRSKIMMTGNKKKLFGLCLSMLGWFLLASIPFAAVDEMNMFTESGILQLICYIPICIVAVYLNTATAQFYELLSDKDK